MELKNHTCITSKSVRGTGGCMLLINEAFKIEDVQQPDCGMMVACKICIQDEWIGIVNVYAPNNMQERKMLWGLLNELSWDVPIIFGGDWNFDIEELLSPEWVEWSMKFDTVYMGTLQGCKELNQPTWTNRHVQSGFVARRLDRVYLSGKGFLDQP